jgi:hypothetical protein
VQKKSAAQASYAKIWTVDCAAQIKCKLVLELLTVRSDLMNELRQWMFPEGLRVRNWNAINVEEWRC